MAATVINGIDDLRGRVGEELGVSDWVEVTQEMIDAFADATGDHQWIHVAPERAKETPFGGTIAHGLFTLGLGPKLSYEMFSIEGIAFGINYGYDRVRFPAPLPVGAQWRGTSTITEVRPIEGGVQVHVTTTVEVRDQPKPAMVADGLLRFYA